MPDIICSPAFNLEKVRVPVLAGDNFYDKEIVKRVNEPLNGLLMGIKISGLFATFFVFLSPWFFCVDAVSQSNDTLDLSKESPATGGTDYVNYAQTGTYENDFWVGEVREWHYYDLFGNYLLDGFSLYGMSLDRNSEGAGESTIRLHPFMKKWFNGLLQVGDISDNGGVLGILGEGIKTRFTPYSLNQSYYTGARFDIFSNWFQGLNSASIITSRISNTGKFGMIDDYPSTTPNGDWLHGIQLSKKYKDIIEVGATYLNLHHEDGMHPNSLSGWDSDSLATHTPTALSVSGFDGRCNFPEPKVTLYGEYKRSQEVLDGDFKPREGNVGTVNGYWDFLNRGRVGGEGYLVESRFKTTFFCPADSQGDVWGGRNYLYALIEDNDDKDPYPENGDSKLLAIPKGDPDGVIPIKYDKNKNGRYDFEEDFLSYDCDPPKSRLYFDRNNNGTPDDVEDDAYPDYTYVPSYYLPGERYLRYDDMDRQTKTYTSDGQASKGLLGLHLYGRYEILPKLNVTLGGMVEKSQESSYKSIYEDTTAVGEIYAPEKATTLYSLVQYKKDFTADKNLKVENFTRMIKDNIPNHTQNFTFDSDSAVVYQTVVDELDYRDAVVNAFIAQYSIYRNRGFNLTNRGKYEFTKHFAHLEYNYPEANISSLILVNKCHYIYLLPLLKDMFLIPKYKNIYENDGYGPRVDRLDLKFRNHSMINIADLVYEWKFTEKTAVTLGVQGKTFNDFNNANENYYMRDFAVQLLIKDRYVGLNIIMTTGASVYRYTYYNTSGIIHNPFNNPHRITDNISSYELFLKVHGGF